MFVLFTGCFCVGAVVVSEQLKSDLSIFIPWCIFGIAWAYGMVSLFKWAIELGVI
ncbi:TMhelix containing protein [Vibrio phage 1.154.O._10N.222.52.B12]|nr:TMhelix containing protein [Vibrio phage 1.154.O._10N.222.52.B12]